MTGLWSGGVERRSRRNHRTNTDGFFRSKIQSAVFIAFGACLFAKASLHQAQKEPVSQREREGKSGTLGLKSPSSSTTTEFTQSTDCAHTQSTSLALTQKTSRSRSEAPKCPSSQSTSRVPKRDKPRNEVRISAIDKARDDARSQSGSTLIPLLQL